MAYQSLYRRYRPQRFAEVRGQEHLVRGLQNAVREGRVAHAYLFSGPRGTGKTSTARILAKVLNCENVVDAEPCGECESCVAIEQGTSFDVHELDAASNNGVENVRDLISKAALGTPGRTKVYILDEVHMLTAAASNALLKILEEAPDHVVFVLATTDPQKVLPTIRSRCQHYELHLLTADELTELARFVADDAGLELTDEAIDHAVRAGQGSPRDMESALERVATVGLAPDDTQVLDELIEALAERDTARALVAVEQGIAAGRAPRVVGEELLARLRDVFLAAVGAPLDRLPDHDRARVSEQAQRLTAAGATRAMDLLGSAFVGIQDSPDPRVPLEVALVRLTKPEADVDVGALVDRVARLERAAASGEAPPAARPADEPVESEPAATSASGSRPADQAREVLRGRRGSGRAGASTASSKPAPPPPSPPAPARPSRVEASAEKASPAAAPAPAPEPPPESAPGSPLPTRDELTLAWADAVLPSLPRKAKTRFQVGRFMAVEDDAAVFGLPNKIHVGKCEEVRADVEAALAAHFGRVVPLRIVVDDGAPPPPAAGGPPPPEQASSADEIAEIDLSELTDATDAATSTVERVAQVFPGAELVEEE